MIGGAAMEQVYLSGKIRDRIQDLMKTKRKENIRERCQK